MKIDPSLLITRPPDAWYRSASQSQGRALQDMFAQRAQRTEPRNSAGPRRNRPDALTPPDTEGRPIARMALPEADATVRPSPGKGRSPTGSTPNVRPWSNTAEGLTSAATPEAPRVNSAADFANRPSIGKGRVLTPPLPPRSAPPPATIAVRLADTPRGIEVSARLLGSGEFGDTALRDRIATLLESHGLRFVRWSLNGVPQWMWAGREAD